MKNNELQVITGAMLDKKAQNVVSLDLRPVGSAISDWFVVCNADSTTAVAAIADNILVKMQEDCGKKVLRMQGLENDFWIILDFGDIVVHVFLTEYRQFYRLEELWADALRKEWVDEPKPVRKTAARKSAEDGTPARKAAKPKAASKVRASVKKSNKTENE